MIQEGGPCASTWPPARNCGWCTSPAHARSASRGRRASGQPARRATDESLREARATYETLRKDLPGDDITPELFLYAALSDYQLYEDMGRAVAEMLRKQPDNEDVKTLDAWLKIRVK